MNSASNTKNGFGPDFPNLFERLLLTLLMPIDRRTELVGDLIEEAESLILPRDGRTAARRWFWRQALASASPLYARQTSKEINMNRWKWITVVLLLVAGPLMALDPSVLSASGPVIALVALAILIPAATGLVSGNLHVLVGAATLSAVLLLAARLVSGIEIRWYAMAFIIFVILRLGQIFERQLSSS